MRYLDLLLAFIALIFIPRNVVSFSGTFGRRPLSTNLNHRLGVVSKGAPLTSAAKTQSSRYRFEVYGGGSLDGDLDGKNSTGINFKKIIPIVGLVALVGAAGGHVGGLDFSALIESSVSKIASMGPYGYLYFAFIYIVAEILAIPAMPLTASSGYLFGLVPGFLTVLASATIAAAISFFIGRTLLRGWAQKIASSSAKWRAVDSAVGKEGFKVILLLRMSPLLPFAISNYLYGLTSVDFWSYITATCIGFAPGTLGIVYAGSAGKALFSAEGLGSLPWYVYLGAGGLLFLFANTVARIATETLKTMQEEEEAATAAAAAAKGTGSGASSSADSAKL